MVETGAMSAPRPAPEERYAAIVQQIVAEDPEVSADSVTAKRMFGMNGGMKIAGKLFAFLAKGRIIIKLPKQRVDALIAAGHGEPCVMGRGRVMKEWVVVPPDFQDEWPALIGEAKDFVADCE
jgi:TfoX/Sxy family transcriptional regulator of competence genes